MTQETKKDKKAKKSKANRITNIVLNVIIVFLVALIVLRMFIPDVILNVFGVNMYVVVSPSMEPLIMTNDTVFVRRINENRLNQLQPGDIIVFYGDTVGVERRIIHFFYEILPDGSVRTYAMNNADEQGNWVGPGFDPAFWNVTTDRIIGTHIGTIRTANFFRVARDPLFIVSIILFIGATVGLIIIYKSHRKKKAQEALAHTDENTDVSSVVIDEVPDQSKIDDKKPDSDKKSDNDGKNT